jgi:hypothetical protein
VNGRRQRDLLWEAQLSAKHLDARVSAQANFWSRKFDAGSHRVDGREPFEGFERAVSVAKQSVNRGLPLREVAESRGDLFGLRAPAVDRMDLRFYTSSPTDREFVERFKCLGSIALDEQRPLAGIVRECKGWVRVVDLPAIVQRVLIQPAAQLDSRQDAPHIERQGVGLERGLQRALRVVHPSPR